MSKLTSPRSKSCIVGYARVSTDDQNLNLKYARAGDTIVVWRLDRLSRSLKDLIEMVTLLESKGIGLKSLQEAIDTSSSLWRSGGI